MGAQKFMGAQKLLRGHDASASLRHPQMAPNTHAVRLHVHELHRESKKQDTKLLAITSLNINRFSNFFQ